MNTAHYDKVFLVPVARPTPMVRPASRSNSDAVSDWEFSDAMRDPRFLPGWYMLPALAFAALAVALAVWL